MLFSEAMTVGADAGMWHEVDPWWDKFIETHSPVHIDKSSLALDDSWYDSIENDIDPWWNVVVETHAVSEVDEVTASLDSTMRNGLWEQIDQWWESYAEDHSLAVVEGSIAVLDQRWHDGQWKEMDPWWDTYSEQQRQEAEELADLLRELDNRWKESDSSFDTDPLTVNWAAGPNTHGPLRPHQEENWSQWLAHLLRSNGEFVAQLFGEQFEEVPDSVRREVHLPSRNSNRPDRYADILLFADNRGISIEVKKGDEHYEKTAHTAVLVEHHHYEDWEHVLLVPEYKKGVLKDRLADLLVSDEERLQIDGQQSGPLKVVFWREVTSSIRETLLFKENTDHWEASAYLFCTLVEQKILGFDSQETVADLASASDVIHMSVPLSVPDGDVGKQLRYLREIGLSNDDD